jgi:hypothetical protein
MEAESIESQRREALRRGEDTSRSKGLVAFLEVLMSVRKVCCATALTTIAGARK